MIHFETLNITIMQREHHLLNCIMLQWSYVCSRSGFIILKFWILLLCKGNIGYCIASCCSGHMNVPFVVSSFWDSEYYYYTKGTLFIGLYHGAVVLSMFPLWFHYFETLNISIVQREHYWLDCTMTHWSYGCSLCGFIILRLWILLLCKGNIICWIASCFAVVLWMFQMWFHCFEVLNIIVMQREHWSLYCIMMQLSYECSLCGFIILRLWILLLCKGNIVYRIVSRCICAMYFPDAVSSFWNSEYYYYVKGTLITVLHQDAIVLWMFPLQFHHF